MTCVPLIAATLCSLQLSGPFERTVDVHLHVSDNSESRAIIRALSISTAEPPGTMAAEDWQRIAVEHERIRLDIAAVARVHVHRDQIPRWYHTPSYAFSKRDKGPRPFGWYTQTFTGRRVRAWQDTYGILKHLRYLCRLAAQRRQYRHSGTHFQGFTSPGYYDPPLVERVVCPLVWGERSRRIGIRLCWSRVNPVFEVYPPVSHLPNLTLTLCWGWHDQDWTTPGRGWMEQLVRRQLDMDTGLLWHKDTGR